VASWCSRTGRHFAPIKSPNVAPGSLRSVRDLVLQMAGIMIAAESTQRRIIELKENVTQLLGWRITGGKTLSVNLAQRIRVLPCLWLISPSWLRWRLSRPALLMVLSIVTGTKASSRRVKMAILRCNTAARCAVLSLVLSP
jgi:hypothetical protein